MRKTAFLAAAGAVFFIPYAAHSQAVPVTSIVTGVTNTLTGVTGTVTGVTTGVTNTVTGVTTGVTGTVAGVTGGVTGALGGATGLGGSLTAGALSGGAGASDGSLTTASLPSAGGSAFGPGSGGSIASISLPSSLAPLDLVGGARFTALCPGIGQVSGTRGDLQRCRTPLRARPGTPQPVVKNARDTIVASALAYGVVRVDAVSAGPMRQTAGGFVAPVEVRIVYSRQGGLETRQSVINVRLNTEGRVIAAA